MHYHAEHCAHANLRYCKTCDETYCTQCKRAWGHTQTWTYNTFGTSPYVYTTPAGGTGVYGHASTTLGGTGNADECSHG